MSTLLVYLCKVLILRGDDGVLQHQRDQLDDVIALQAAAVGALHTSPEVAVQCNVQQQNVPLSAF